MDEQQPRRIRRRLRWGRVALLAGAALIVVVAGAMGGLVVGTLRGLPPVSAPAGSKASTSAIYDEAGQWVTTVPGAADRQPLAGLSGLPSYLPQAFVAIEDRRFYSEPGIDPIGILRAAWQDLVHERVVEGASTITQQLARTAFPIGHGRTLRRKLQEALLAVELNRHYSKAEILTLFLNDSYFGERSVGIQAASETYFGHAAHDDTLGQAALLAGLLQSPAGDDPFVHPQAAMARRNAVLRQLVRQHYVGAAQAARAEAQTLAQTGLLPKQPAAVDYPYPWYVDAVMHELTAQLHLSQTEIYQGGLQIYTSLDPAVQMAAQRSIGVLDSRFPATAQAPLQVGLAVIRQDTGGVVAIVGGRRHTQALAFDRATQAERQPGGAITPPAVYIPALEHGMTAATVVDDAPIAFPNGRGGLWVPENGDGRFEGLTTLREAVRRSVRVVAVRVLDGIGVGTGYRNAVRMGLDNLRPADRNLTLALGTTSDCCTALEMAATYATIADGGIRRQPVIVREIKDAQGRVIYQARSEAEQVVPAQVDSIMTSMLESVVEPQPAGGWDDNRGTAPLAAVPGWPVAGKTGMAAGDQTAWFAGFTPEYTAAVWLGYDHPRPLPPAIAGSYAAPIFAHLMRAALASDRPVGFPAAPGLVRATIDAKSGLAPGPLTPPQWTRDEIFATGTAPEAASTIWVQRQVVEVPRAAVQAAGTGAQRAAQVGTGQAEETGQRAQAGTSVLALWDPGCPLPPQTRVFLDRRPVTAADVQVYADLDHVTPASMIPVDMALAPPRQTCSQLLGQGGSAAATGTGTPAVSPGKPVATAVDGVAT